MSFQGMLNIVKGVSEFHDVEAQYWGESILEGYLKKQKANRLAHLGRHKVPAFGKDFDTLLSMLMSEKVFQPQNERCHPTFKFRKGLLQHYSSIELQKKIKMTLHGHGLL